MVLFEPSIDLFVSVCDSVVVTIVPADNVEPSP